MHPIPIPRPCHKISMTLAFLILLVPAASRAQTYCWPGFQMACFYGDKITRVVFAGINHSDTECANDADGKKDFTTTVPPANVVRGSSYALHVTAENNLSSGTERLRAWIDYNRNFVFEAAESIDLGAGTGNTTLTAAVTIPAGATPGLTRMRIMYRRTSSNPLNATDACHSYTSYRGQVKDYAVNITSALPIQILSFNASKVKNAVHLNWVTATETGNDFYTIERSANGTHWHSLGDVKGAGTSSQANVYTYTDEAPLQGESYYRLRQTDYDKNFTYSDIVPVEENPGDMADAVYPNPFTDVLQISFAHAGETAVMRNTMGKVVLTLEAGEAPPPVTVPVSTLPRGIYVLTLYHGLQQRMYKLVKQ